MLHALPFLLIVLLAPFGALATEARSPVLHSASRLVGIPVTTPGGEVMGEVQDLMVDLANNRITYAVIASGGVLGIGDTPYLVPWEAVRLTEDERSVILDVNPKNLSKAPQRRKDQSDADFARETHRFYRITPYWESAAGKRKNKEGGTR